MEIKQHTLTQPTGPTKSRGNFDNILKFKNPGGPVIKKSHLPMGYMGSIPGHGVETPHGS